MQYCDTSIQLKKKITQRSIVIHQIPLKFKIIELMKKFSSNHENNEEEAKKKKVAVTIGNKHIDKTENIEEKQQQKGNDKKRISKKDWQ